MADTAISGGRGAVSNREGRFERFQSFPFDDGWGEPDGATPFVRTRVSRDHTKSIIARNESPDLPFRQSINPYRGCEHGCVYCFARPTHAYLGLSPGLDFETKLFAKPNAAALLAGELARPGYRCDMLALGTNTDPYQPIERRYRITRSILELLSETSHPVGIVTKSNLVVRDVDVLASLASRRLAHVTISVTTLDNGLARAMEPRASTPERRLGAIRALREAGVPVGVLAAPVIPVLNEPELEDILAACRGAGASWASYVLLRLPLEVRELFEEWLSKHAPAKATHVMNAVRAMRGGKAYDASFGQRFTGRGRGAELLAWRFEVAARRLGFEQEPELDFTAFRPPNASARVDARGKRGKLRSPGEEPPSSAQLLLF